MKQRIKTKMCLRLILAGSRISFHLLFPLEYGIIAGT
jgi:hypothetical protein